MIEIKYGGKVYIFPEGSEILDKLDMLAEDVRDDTDSSQNVVQNPVYTHDEAHKIVEKFEDLLCAKDITVPCADVDEEADRYQNDENEAALYGTEYSDLLDGVENDIIAMLDAAGVKNYVAGVFSGNY